MNRQERLREYVRNAAHSSVDTNTLDQPILSGPSIPMGGNSRVRTVLSYLRSGGQPHFVLYAKSNTSDIYGPTGETAPERTPNNSVYHVVTDDRWLVITGDRNGNETLSIPLADVEAANYDTDAGLLFSVSNNRVVLKTEEACHDIPVLTKTSQQTCWTVAYS